ncbi:MAG TPA: carbohydrate-binding family 9-like protein [Bryobacteraceae bacterium]|jgi:hypothetical protein
MSRLAKCLSMIAAAYLWVACGQFGRSESPPPPAAARAAASRPADLDGDWAAMRRITPRGYVCARAKTPIVIDGRADEPAWESTPWTQDFADIEGDRRPAPRFRTRARMLWDDDCLYVYAELSEPHVWGTITQNNRVIFHDNDFEVFIDPDGDNHNYYEFEMNALNTIWELTLEKPYRDGGPVRNATNIKGLRSAVHVDGTLNDPADTDRGWSVELAIPWTGLARYAATGRRACPPRDGDQWRMNFSRVEWLIDIIDGKYRKIPREMRPEDNWIWSPQGVVDMHRPERWGYVQFTASPDTATFRPDPTLAARDTLMTVYHRQRAFRERTGRHAISAAELGLPADAVELTAQGRGYTATTHVTLPGGATRVLHVREDSRLWED